MYAKKGKTMGRKKMKGINSLIPKEPIFIQVPISERYYKEMVSYCKKNHIELQTFINVNMANAFYKELESHI